MDHSLHVLTRISGKIRPFSPSCRQISWGIFGTLALKNLASMDVITAAHQPLGLYPTPLTPLPRLTAYLGGPAIYIKRDDLSGMGFGGNKIRKLEFLLGEALALGCDAIITGGSEQSNHCRQTAAAAAVYGLSCHLVLGGQAVDKPKGNLLLDLLFGAEIHWGDLDRKGESLEHWFNILSEQGKKPYLIPYGGSNPTGALGFVKAVDEITIQMQEQHLEFTHLLFASSSGGTQAGLIVGSARHESAVEILGIGIDKEPGGDMPYAKRVLDLTNQTAARLNLDIIFNSKQIKILEDYHGRGYAQPGKLEIDAIRLLARLEGIVLDPVYTGRAMGGMIDLIRKGFFRPDDRILFWHTGGGPSLFAFSDILV